MLNFFIKLILFKTLLANISGQINLSGESLSYSKNGSNGSTPEINSTNFYVFDNINNPINASIKTPEKVYSLDDKEKNEFKRKDSDLKETESSSETRKKASSSSNSKENLNVKQKIIENPKRNIFIDFDLIVNEFLNFEPKTGMIELDAKLRYRWWDTKSSITSSTSSSEIDEDLSNFKNIRLSPIIKFADDLNVKLNIKNQLYSFNNVETFFERKKETQQTILAKFEKFKSTNNKAVAAALLSNNNADVYMSSSYKNVSLNKKVLMSKVFRHYSCLEQNVTLKFKCKTDEDRSVSDTFSSPLDTSAFPFDAHACELNFDIVASFSQSENKLQLNEFNRPVFSFSSLIPDDPNKIEIDNNLFEFYSYNKLVQASSNYSWISKEWLLKKITLFYSNLTTEQFGGIYLASSGSSSGSVEMKNLTANNDQHEKLDQYLMSRKDLINNSNNNKSNNITSRQQGYSSFYDKFSSLLPRVGVKFYIYRRREPQVYIFVLPLVLFTLITFLIFFLPTSNTSEKTLIAFLNFSCMLGYNIYLFKLVIFTYDFMRMPLILQYSNCLMVIQLGVLAYTCLVKSVYHYGFLTFNASSFSSLAEDMFKQMFFMNQDHFVQFETEKHRNQQNLMALTCGGGQYNQAFDVYSQGDNNLRLNQLVSKSNSRSSTSSNGMLNNKCDEKIKEETGMVIYHGKFIFTFFQVILFF